MGARLEWLTATETTPDLLRRGDEASDHTEVTGPFAMVFGHPDGAIIQGSLPAAGDARSAPRNCSTSPSSSRSWNPPTAPDPHGPTHRRRKRS